MKPTRIQLSRKKGWRKPENTVVVSRPTKWGNPWIVRYTPNGWQVLLIGKPVPGAPSLNYLEVETFNTEREARQHAVNMYDQSLTPMQRAEIKITLKGKNLACWCPLKTKHGKYVPCHADTLLRIANSP